MSEEYTYDIDKYTIGVDTNGEDGIGMTVAKIENGELHFLGNCYGENARCIDLLIKENKELKKQLEPNYYVKGLEGALKEYHQEMNKVTIQQKEFIKWLEDEIKNTQIKWGDKLTENGYIDIAMTVRAYRIILQKYKEIIGEKQ